MLVVNGAEDAAWPTELLQLRDILKNKYEAKLEEMNEKHEKEISRLKEENLKNLSGVMERAKRRSSKENEENLTYETDIYKER